MPGGPAAATHTHKIRRKGVHQSYHCWRVSEATVRSPWVSGAQIRAAWCWHAHCWCTC